MPVDEQGPLQVRIRPEVAPVDTAFRRALRLAPNALQQVDVLQGRVGERDDIVVESTGVVYANPILEPAAVVRAAVIREQRFGGRDQIAAIDGRGHLVQTRPVEIERREQISCTLGVACDEIGRGRERHVAGHVAGLAGRQHEEARHEHPETAAGGHCRCLVLFELDSHWRQVLPTAGGGVLVSGSAILKE